jgi:hypothetical protein
MRWLTICALVMGCTPIVPFQTMETADVLRRGEVAATAAGGFGPQLASRIPTVGDDGAHCCFAGGGARVRVGLDGRQEVGAEIAAVGHSWQNGRLDLVGGKLSWKLGALPWLALVAGAGGNWVNNDGAPATGALGGDLAALVSPPRHPNTKVAPYVGLRASFAGAVGPRADGLEEALVAPLGIAIGEVARFFIEAAFVGAMDQWHSPDGTLRNSLYAGMYGALGFTYIFRR